MSALALVVCFVVVFLVTLGALLALGWLLEQLLP